MEVSLDDKIVHAPRKPGVYLMKNLEGKILYIGKARDLRARVRAYLRGTDTRPMISFLMEKVRDIEFIVTCTEKEALILENNLIKTHHPRYNVDFRDDKAYFHIRIDPRDEYPRFQLFRRPKKDGARYFGPYPSSSAAKETLRFLQSIFPLRTCRDRDFATRRRPCLEFDIGRCNAPCAGRVERVAYFRLVEESLSLLEGRGKALLANLRAGMEDASQNLRFEEAAALRDRIAAIEETIEKQRVESTIYRNRDIFGVCREGGLTQVCALFVRKGRVVGQKIFPLVRIGLEPAEILSSLIKQYYDTDTDIPDEILIPAMLEDESVIREWLSEKRGRIVVLIVPQRGEGRDLLMAAERNAEQAFQQNRFREDNPEEALHLLAVKLRLKHDPQRIECFDISNIGGNHAVGSKVTFAGGRPDKTEYRRYKIKTVEGADDYAMMYEVLKRRFTGGKDLPDLLMLDGGKGQVSVAQAVLKDLGITGVDIIGLAKERRVIPGRPQLHKSTITKDMDRIYLPGRKGPLYLTQWQVAYFLLQRIRDEAHRFAVTYHRKLKEKRDLRSLLDDIPGIGAERKKALLMAFGDIRHIRAAGTEDLQRVAGIGKETAAKIRDFLPE
jgi:excinuclease ABC subunit C